MSRDKKAEESSEATPDRKKIIFVAVAIAAMSIVLVYSLQSNNINPLANNSSLISPPPSSSPVTEPSASNSPSSSPPPTSNMAGTTTNSSSPFSSASSSTGTYGSASFAGGLQMIPSLAGYEGAHFISQGNDYTLNPNAKGSTRAHSNSVSSPATGTLEFVFSNQKYPESALSVAYVSCFAAGSGGSSSQALTGSSATGNTSGTGPRPGLSAGMMASNEMESCSAKVPLKLSSYSQNAQGKSVVTADISESLSCGGQLNSNGASRYLDILFGVNTIGMPSAAPYYYTYTISASCN